MIKQIALSFIVGMFAVSAFAAEVELTDAQRNAIEERIQPVGQSCLEGETDCGGAKQAAAASGDGAAVATAARSGEEVYNAACLACHMTGAAGAPKLGDAAAWVERIAKGTDVLYESGINGLPGTGMMAKGGCFACTDAEVNAAVDYMITGSQ